MWALYACVIIHTWSARTERGRRVWINNDHIEKSTSFESAVIRFENLSRIKPSIVKIDHVINHKIVWKANKTFFIVVNDIIDNHLCTNEISNYLRKVQNCDQKINTVTIREIILFKNLFGNILNRLAILNLTPSTLKCIENLTYVYIKILFAHTYYSS